MRKKQEVQVHTYFLRTSVLGDERKPVSYEWIQFHSSMIEEVIKPSLEGDMARKYTLTGHYVVNNREYLPQYSGISMANADLFLYQVYNGLELDDLTYHYGWFPRLYIYAEQYDSMWKKLVSKRFCEKIMPIFGVNTIDELKVRISKCEYDSKRHYRGAYPAARAILSWIKIEDVATLP